MEYFLDHIYDKFEIAFGALFAALILIAIIRSAVKAAKGQRVSVPPVGVMKDLPGSATGISRHEDMTDRSHERTDNKSTE